MLAAVPGTALAETTGAEPAPAATAAPAKDVPYIPTPPEVVQRMIALGEVRSGDVVYDLGCGDGRIVIEAVKIDGVRGVCVEIDAAVLSAAQGFAAASGVADRIEFVQGNLFAAPIDDATVVMLYLLPSLNLRLRPRLLEKLQPGSRVVSHAFDMGTWVPERKETVRVGDADYEVFRWMIPEREPKTDAPPRSAIVPPAQGEYPKFSTTSAAAAARARASDR
jgi:SAM-dependent methyltransferase